MAVLAATAGLLNLRGGRALLAAHAGLCALSVALLFGAPKTTERKDREAGYVLAAKFGDDPRIVTAIAQAYPESEADLLRGAGWGTAVTLLASYQPTQHDIDTLGALASQYSRREQLWFCEGLSRALSRDTVRPCR